MTTLGYLGPEGTFSFVAAQQYGQQYRQEQGVTVELRPYKTIDSALDAVLRGEVEQVVVPEFNTQLGKIKDFCAVDALEQLVKVGEVRVPVQMAVGGVTEFCGDIRVVYSKNRALEQCTNYLSQLFGVERGNRSCEEYVKLLESQHKVVLTESTTSAMEKIKLGQIEGAVAIGPVEGFRLYGLCLYTSNVHDDPGAQTMFAVVQKK